MLQSKPEGCVFLNHPKENSNEFKNFFKQLSSFVKNKSDDIIQLNLNSLNRFYKFFKHCNSYVLCFYMEKSKIYCYSQPFMQIQNVLPREHLLKDFWQSQLQSAQCCMCSSQVTLGPTAYLMQQQSLIGWAHYACMKGIRPRRPQSPYRSTQK